MSKLNESTTLLAFSPPKLHNVLIHHNLHNVFIQGMQLPGTANLQLKGITGTRHGGCHVLPLRQQLPIVLLAWPSDDEEDTP